MIGENKMKKLCSLLLILCLLFCLAGCGESKPEDNIAFESIEEMQECLNGKWFSVQGSFIGPEYSEIIFDDDEIKECTVFGWVSKRIEGEDGTTDLEYELKQYENLEFKNYGNTDSPQFKHKIGRVLFGLEHLNIDIKEYVDIVEETEVKEKCLVINNRVYFKSTDKIDLSCENFEIFQNFCELALSRGIVEPFISMYYRDGDEESDIEKGIDDDAFFVYEGCDSDEISFEIAQYEYTPVHYFARTDEFEFLYNEIKDLFLRRINILGLIGTRMSDFEKKDWAKNHIFEELDYYLYMNSEGKLVSNNS